MSHDFLDHSNISYFEQVENLPLKTLRPEIFEVFEEETLDVARGPSRGKPSKDFYVREQEDHRSSATQRKHVSKGAHRREVSDILSGYATQKESERRAGNSISKG